MLKIDAEVRFAPGCGDTSYLFGQRVTTGSVAGLAIGPFSFTRTYPGLYFL
jgi:hypothetical protein